MKKSWLTLILFVFVVNLGFISTAAECAPIAYNFSNLPATLKTNIYK